ncbi:hypothetical protein CAPI_06945 [Corynebacterium capitovis DSM 44611]|nr:hypothetical protein CAPI_06945 [Corynebacterium capitovis DSM 44611]
MPPRSPRSQSAAFVGLATGSAVAITFAALFTGCLLSVYAGEVSWPFLTLYAVAAILTVTFVQPRGMFLTVACAPILFLLGVLGTGWFLSRGDTSRTALLVVFYPLVQLFPVLFTVTAGAIVIAVLRVKLIKRQNAIIARRDQYQRLQTAESNRRTATQSRRVRERSNAVTVQELMERRSGKTD